MAIICCSFPVEMVHEWADWENKQYRKNLIQGCRGLVSTSEWKAKHINARSKEIRAAANSRVESWRRLERFPLGQLQIILWPHSKDWFSDIY
jgi:hypothetical protein